MVTAVVEKEHYLTTIKAGKNQLLADEALSKGGGEKGFAPMELLASSLAACTSITLRMYADRKQWNVGQINVNVELTPTENGSARFERSIQFSETLEAAQIERLLYVAGRCPVHKLLTGTIIINTQLAS